MEDTDELIDMSGECGDGLNSMREKMSHGEITQEEFDKYIEDNCKKCIFFSNEDKPSCTLDDL